MLCNTHNTCMSWLDMPGKALVHVHVSTLHDLFHLFIISKDPCKKKCVYKYGETVPTGSASINDEKKKTYSLSKKNLKKN